jgi:hypothetical protein
MYLLFLQNDSYFDNILIMEGPVSMLYDEIIGKGKKDQQNIGQCVN